MSSTSQRHQGEDLAIDFSKIKVTILASEWESSNHGEIAIFSKQLALQLAKIPELEITTFLITCSEKDRKEALRNNVKIVEAKRRPGFDESIWLNFPPEHLQIDIIIGHGVELGCQAQIIKESKKCIWVQLVYTDLDEQNIFKSSANATAKGQENHSTEIELCEMADLVVAVGPKLCEAFRTYLRQSKTNQSVVDFTPGIFAEFKTVTQSPDERKYCNVLVFAGCADEDDFELRGIDIACKAVSTLSDTRLMFAGVPDALNEKLEQKVTECGVSRRLFRVRRSVQNREELKKLFYEVDLVLMPSRSDGFGFTCLEALSAGVPVLASKNTGFGEALSKVPFGLSFVISSEDSKVWAAAIEKVREKDRQSRLEEAKRLRISYEKKYDWAKQTRDLCEQIVSLVRHGASIDTTPVTGLQKQVAGTKRRAECSQDVRRVLENTFECLKSGQGDVQQGLTQLEVERQGSASPQISCEIANCEADIAFFANRHDPDTRQWLLNDFWEWFDDPKDSKAYVLLGDAGVGKSVMSGALARQTKLAGHLGAAYFCRHNDRTRNNPRNLLGTIASQQCDSNRQYNNIIGGKDGVKLMLANPTFGVLELCTKLLEEPLGRCSPSQPRKLVIIDALDETEYTSREDFLCLIKERFPRLPEGLLFFITSRPEDVVQTRLKNYNPCVRICAGNSEQKSFYQHHEEDIQKYLMNNVNFSRLRFSVEDVAKKCNGLFLYAFYIAKKLNELLDSGKTPLPSDLFPRDIEDFFRTNLLRVYDKVGSDLYRKLLGCILCAPSPLPVSVISYVIDREGSNINEQEIIDAVSQFLVLEKTATFLHDLIPKWLTNKEKARKLYIDKERAFHYFKEILSKIFSQDVNWSSDLHDCLTKGRKKSRTH